MGVVELVTTRGRVQLCHSTWEGGPSCHKAAYLPFLVGNTPMSVGRGCLVFSSCTSLLCLCTAWEKHLLCTQFSLVGKPLTSSSWCIPPSFNLWFLNFSWCTRIPSQVPQPTLRSQLENLSGGYPAWPKWNQYNVSMFMYTNHNFREGDRRRSFPKTLPREWVWELAT